MKLSQVLKDWPEKMKNNHDGDGCELCDSLCDDNPCESAEIYYNTALTSCDREIDREALAKALYDEFCNAMSWENTSEPTKIIYRGYAVGIISTMPTWLKRIEKK